MKIENNQIELRSEKVSNIMGQIPSRLIRYGMLLIIIIILMIFSIAYILPYKETLPLIVSIKTNSQVKIIRTLTSGKCILVNSNDTVSANETLNYIISSDSLYKITAPISGKLIRNITNDEYVNCNKVLYIIKSKYYYQYGESIISSELIHKIKIGYKVILKMHNMEIIGYVKDIHPITDGNNNKIIISFIDSNTVLQPNKNYSAEIGLSNISLLKKFFSFVIQNGNFP